MWQFMSSRARGYGLQHNLWVDERQDPEKATRAAAHHLKDLYNQFGDWYLAMAAYNSGPGAVQSAVKRTGYADFWELYKRNVLPKETRNYVPIILAMTIMVKNPAQYGLDNIVPEQPVPYDTVKIDYSVDIRLVAQCVDVSPATLQDLNPSLLRLSTPKDQAFELHLPFGTRERYLSAIEPIPPQMRVWWRYHEVAEGETLASIARTYRTSPAAIEKENHLQGGGPQAGQQAHYPHPAGQTRRHRRWRQLRPPHHPLQGATGGHGPDCRRQFQPSADHDSPLEPSAGRQPARTPHRLCSPAGHPERPVKRSAGGT